MPLSWRPRGTKMPAAHLRGAFDPTTTGTFRVRLRQEDGSWKELRTFGSAREGAEFLDEEVGSGHGTLDDYEIEHVPGARWLRALTFTAVAALVIVFLLIVASYIIAR